LGRGVAEEQGFSAHTESLPLVSGGVCAKYEGDEQGTAMDYN